jgi:hypothetical protein
VRECKGSGVETDWPVGVTARGVVALIGEGVACAGEGVGFEKFTTSPWAFLMTMAALFLGGSVKLGFGAGLLV